uniref:Reverse transcriptase domain-containing protein n=1 Tax=Tanacetum cinerariifolium TaxID=118510 RepID=A0A6L2NMF9_TANCI|nr:hypothetical protein [Tanacetum cinerariifolium]
MPLGIVDKDYDSKRDILIRKDLPSNNTLSFAEKESFHFDIPLFFRPPAKPPDEPFNNQTIDELPQTLPSFDLTCYFEDGNSFTYDSKSNLVHDSPNVFDPPSQPLLYSCKFCENDARRRKAIEEDQAAKAQYWKIPACYDDYDDNYTFAITHNEPDNSLSMGDEHLNTIPATKSDEFIKSIVENLIPNPSESEGEYEYIPKKIYLNPLFDEEISSIKIYPHHFNVESNLIESLLNRDSSIISSSSKIDSLFDEFAGELTLLKSTPPGINEIDCDPEEETHFIKRLLYDNSSPHPPEEFVSENSNTTFESFSPFPILVEDNDSLMEEIDLSFTPNDPMPSGIEDDDYDSERDILILEELLSNDSLSLLKMSHFILIFLHPLVLLQNHRMPSAECPMMIYGKNTPILDVPCFHFYRP